MTNAYPTLNSQLLIYLTSNLKKNINPQTFSSTIYQIIHLDAVRYLYSLLGSERVTPLAVS